MRKTILIRSIFGAIGFNCFVFAPKYLQVFIASTIINTQPFFVAIMAFIVNRESISKHLLLCMIGCFTGVIILNSSVKEDDKKIIDRQSFILGMISIFTFVVCSSMVNVLQRKMREVHFAII